MQYRVIVDLIHLSLTLLLILFPNTLIVNLDFSPVSQLLVFNAGNSGAMMCVNIPIIDDALCEGTEQFAVRLDSTFQNVAIAPGRGTGTVIITDDDGKTENLYQLNIIIIINNTIK